MIARRLVISGRVQGVGFRYALIEVARESGIAGWVRNLRDGAVEALVQGDAVGVERTLAWCRRGPPSANVSNVAVAPVPVEPLAGFELRPSA
ncbi:MAG: acylphosphatase [Aromatoleum sp.]|nr:acylphosphatase [Aromatoleum sp.]